MATFELESFRTSELSVLESQILKEKAKGLSNPEVALKLFLYEREVRAITLTLKTRYANGKIADPPYSHYAANGPTSTLRRRQPLVKRNSGDRAHTEGQSQRGPAQTPRAKTHPKDRVLSANG